MYDAPDTLNSNERLERLGEMSASNPISSQGDDGNRTDDDTSRSRVVRSPCRTADVCASITSTPRPGCTNPITGFRTCKSVASTDGGTPTPVASQTVPGTTHSTATSLAADR